MEQLRSKLDEVRQSPGRGRNGNAPGTQSPTASGGEVDVEFRPQRDKPKEGVLKQISRIFSETTTAISDDVNEAFHDLTAKEAGPRRELDSDRLRALRAKMADLRRRSLDGPAETAAVDTAAAAAATAAEEVASAAAAQEDEIPVVDDKPTPIAWAYPRTPLKGKGAAPFSPDRPWRTGVSPPRGGENGPAPGAGGSKPQASGAGPSGDRRVSFRSQHPRDTRRGPGSKINFNQAY